MTMDIVRHGLDDISKVYIKYNGNNSIDAIDLATSILNFAKLAQTISKDHIPQTHELKVNVFGFEHGSVDTPMHFYIEQIVNNSTVITSVAAIATQTVSISDILSSLSDFFNIFTFLRGLKPKSIRRSVENNRQAIIEDNNGATITVNYGTINYYSDPKIRKYAKSIVEPLEKESSALTSFSLSEEISGERIELAKVEKSEVGYFSSIEDETLIEDVVLVGKVYDMNIETCNGKMSIGNEKTAISFKQIRNKGDFYDLVNSMKYDKIVRIRGRADISTGGGSLYRNIDIFDVHLLEQQLISDE